jgi:PKD repeat protein
MKRLYISLIFVCIIAQTSAQNPVANFKDMSPTCAYNEIQFVNTSIDGIDYYWDFGDGNTSIQKNPVHMYSEAGTYTVKLTVSDNYSTDEINKPVTVYPTPIVSFSLDNIEGCQPLMVTFTNTSTGNHPTTRYVYDFGDGYADEVNDMRMITHTYTNVFGTNRIINPILTATNEWGCVSEPFSQTITIFPYIRAAFLMENFTGCSPLTVRFRNGSMGYSAFQYNFGDGTTLVSDQFSGLITDHIFVTSDMSTDKEYDVKLTVNSGMCSDDVTQQVKVYATPTADFRPPSPYPDDYFYPAPPLQIENLIPLPYRENLSYFWSWSKAGSNYMNNFSSVATPSPLQIDEWGNFEITQRVTSPNSLCSDSKTIAINIIPPTGTPTLTVFSSDITLGGARSYSVDGLLTSTPVNTSKFHSGIAELIAIAQAGKVFVGWDDNNFDNPRTVDVNKNVTYTAVFASCEECEGNGSVTGARELQVAAPLKVFPNPVANILNVQLEGTVFNGSLALFDISGKIVLSHPVTGNMLQIDLSSLLSGNYILRLNENGKLSAGVKIVKE